MLGVLEANPAEPTVSVVTAVHNRERYVESAMDSILGQTFDDLELLAVDDGSTDSWPWILSSYVARDPRVLVQRQKNVGISSVRIVRELAWPLPPPELT